MRVLNLTNLGNQRLEYKIQHNEEIGINETSHTTIKYINFENSVNFFIGANNSRKSRLMRQILNLNTYLTLDQYYYRISKDLSTLNNMLNYLPSEKNIYITNNFRSQSNISRKLNDKYNIIENLLSHYDNSKIVFYITWIEELTTKLNDLLKEPEEKSYGEIIHLARKINSFLTFYVQYEQLINENIISDQDFTIGYISEDLKQKFISITKTLNILFEIEINFYKPQKLYIPILRSALKLSETNSIQCFEITIRQLYEIDENINIYTGLNLYSKIKEHRNDKKTIRENFENFEKLLSHYFFDNKQIDIVALESEPGHIQIYVESDSERKLYELGDGIQSLIILLFPVFMAEPNSWIFIEEPENNMHPKFQILFQEIISKNKYLTTKNLTFFITTHSNHFLNTAMKNSNNSIFQFEQILEAESQYSKINKIEGQAIKLLDLLGANNSSVLLSNCSIWVEGQSDRYIIKALLDSYCLHLKQEPFIEGYHYNFIEYAGSNLTHYIFNEIEENKVDKIRAFLLSNRIFLLADRDNLKDKKHAKFKNLESEYFKYCETGAIEIENILSSIVLEKILKAIFKINIDKFKSPIRAKDYEKIRMGDYLNSKFTEIDYMSRGRISSDGGTLQTYYKNLISSWVLNEQNKGQLNWLEFSSNQHATRITKSVFNFIKNSNPNYLKNN